MKRTKPLFFLSTLLFFGQLVKLDIFQRLNRHYW